MRLLETTSSRFIAVRRDAAHLRLDPPLQLVVHADGIATRGLDERPDHDLHAAGVLPEGVARPILAGVVRERQDRRAGSRREHRAADAVAPGLARGDARAFGKDRYPHSLPEALGALLHDLVARAVPARAVDGDAANGEEAPAHEREPQELLLDDPALRREAA